MKHKILLVAIFLLLIPFSTYSQKQAKEKYNSLDLIVDKKVGEFVKISSGEFMMGSENGFSDEKMHKVIISSSFELGKYEITQQQWKSVMGSNPSEIKGADLPVVNVSWFDAEKFINKLNSKSKLYYYRLPTEAEWEYACRAGTKGDYAGNLDLMGWYKNNSKGELHPVGQKQPNAWGLYDMHGNVYEWCEDWYGDYLTGKSTKVARVFRGGTYNLEAEASRSAERGYSEPGSKYDVLGFRLVRNLKEVV